MAYFIFTVSEDGDMHISGPLDADEVKERVTPDEDGSTYYGTDGFHEELPGNDPMYWRGNKLLIIKGEIVVPEPVKTVTEYKL